MNRNKAVCMGVVGAGRATELHMNALKRFSGVPVQLKCISSRRIEQAKKFAERYGFTKYTTNFNDLLNDDEIDVIDICTPPYLHEDMIKKILLHGKHVICEKPLSGYFEKKGFDSLIGNSIPKSEMYETVLSKLDSLKDVVSKSGKKFMYAENFVYAPAIVKAAEIISSKKSRILFMKGEESLKGSSSHVAGEWSKTGGGTFIRTGTHPLSAILWLKQMEGNARGEDITVESVFADMETITNDLSEYEHRHISARPKDVEDIGVVMIKFSDKSRAVVIATDTLLGGSKNYVELYCNDCAINCRLTMNNLMDTYFLDEDNLKDVYISEMLPHKTGWNNPFLEDEIIRGYTDEMRDFIEAIYYDTEPKSSFQLAYNTTKIVYAAYMSAELRKEVSFK